ncbi:MAG: CGLD27 family protein [Synechococcus sp. ELA057]
MNDLGEAGLPPGETGICPVPPEQRPLEEYEQLCRSWFFRWASGSSADLARPLTLAWSLAMLPALLIASGSLELRRDPLLLVLNASMLALVFPLLLLLRQWLGWSHLCHRLQAESVVYEESGWYDGQIWTKPEAWRQRDLLVARHQVAPVLQRLRRATVLILLLSLSGTGLCQAL